MKHVRGFTLIEILVALTMFAVVGGVLLQLFHNGLRSARLASEQTHAAMLARSKLTELQAFGALTEGELSGEFDDGYRWRATLSENVDMAERYPGTLQPLDLDLVISWGDDETASRFGVETLLLSRRSP
ncbi:MAG: type II secretion system protein [Gammaproteobacteria bacterium]|nr:type II secretion system protein [Gammaproteobacteria bacterium]